MQLVLKSTEICNVRYVLESCINIYLDSPLGVMALWKRLKIGPHSFCGTKSYLGGGFEVRKCGREIEERRHTRSALNLVPQNNGTKDLKVCSQNFTCDISFQNNLSIYLGDFESSKYTYIRKTITLQVGRIKVIISANVNQYLNI